MNWLLSALEIMTLNERSKTELIQMVQKVNENNQKLFDEYMAVQKSKREALKKKDENIEYYKKKMEDYLRQATILEFKVKELMQRLDLKLGKEYNINWNWVDKIVFILKEAGRPLRSSEIIEILHKNDIAFRAWHDPQKSLSPHLTKALHYGRIIGEKQVGQNGYLYSLPQKDGLDQSPEQDA